jgi:hypothetical protein
LEYAPRDPDDAVVFPDLDPELDGRLLGGKRVKVTGSH